MKRYFCLVVNNFFSLYALISVILSLFYTLLQREKNDVIPLEFFLYLSGEFFRYDFQELCIIHGIYYS